MPIATWYSAPGVSPASYRYVPGCSAAVNV